MRKKIIIANEHQFEDLVQAIRQWYEDDELSIFVQKPRGMDFEQIMTAGGDVELYMLRSRKNLESLLLKRIEHEGNLLVASPYAPIFYGGRGDTGRRRFTVSVRENWKGEAVYLCAIAFLEVDSLPDFDETIIVQHERGLEAFAELCFVIDGFIEEDTLEKSYTP